MTYNESDDEPARLVEISRLKQELANLDEELYLLNNRRRLISHRIADLYYELKHGSCID